MNEIPDDDLLVEIVDARPRGGQHVGYYHAPIRVTHIPTGIKAEYGSARSQHINRLIAMDMVLAAITHPKHRP